MKTQKGTTRRVFIFKHVVIKVAIFDWTKIFGSWKFQILKEIILIREHKYNYLSEKKKERKEQKTYLLEKCYQWGLEIIPYKKYEKYFSPWYYLLIGILANINERRFYKKTKNPFVMPTYFSFLGFVNIQKRGNKINFFDKNYFFHLLCQNCANRNQPHVDGHTLEKLENFVLDDDGHIKLVDYGNRQICPFLEMNGENLYNNFKLPE